MSKYNCSNRKPTEHQQKILNYMKENNNFLYSFSPKTLHIKVFKQERSINTIRSDLRRMEEQGWIYRESYGYYRIKIDSSAISLLENPPTLLHGIMVSANIRTELQKAIHGITAKSCVFGGNLQRLKSLGFVEKSNFRLVLSFFFEDDVNRRVTITVHKKGRVDFYLNCSNHPVNFFEFRDVYSFCKGRVGFLGTLLNERIVQFGMAKDFRMIRMEGVSSITLRSFLSNWWRVYNKESIGVTRVEQHLRCDVPVETFIGLFERMFLPVSNGDSVIPDSRRDVT